MPLIPLYLSRVTARGLYAHEWDNYITKECTFELYASDQIVSFVHSVKKPKVQISNWFFMPRTQPKENATVFDWLLLTVNNTSGYRLVQM